MDNPRTLSARAQELLRSPRFSLSKIPQEWGKCHFPDARSLAFFGDKYLTGWGYTGPWSEEEVLWLETLGTLMINKPYPTKNQFTPREIDFFLRERNSIPAFSPETLARLEEFWGMVISAMLEWKNSGKTLQNYRFSSGKVFRELSLPEKIHELKAFFSSEKLAGFYRAGGKIELLDVSDSTVYIALFTGSIPEKALLDWLQLTLAEELREPAINLIPEEFP